ncbi:MAG: hypothetical protein A3I07_01200 [Candidatus Doudnabacteria bacterium RIFCSPLOWO2_02_FULL_42_9]|uniref:GerMN domain-containing protein n=1 Tax=Candidatus Doudnabacteria bacterium RIFCSPHIGHO2_01_FULL_41_86 TaxID=1817821 RepID=A0A1F5N9D5_9BACT|nr:MAG: hypothetical protein A2717_00765 [Candidatus Doudnabacteria bacterium RIFCSPHIGHO2_01_FULL_41_86]OGE75375.1 MAG: hypothetical protein A3K07_01275 [Candidatus Doudnabacteria bacterium RIFCSPHIGHO2_01_43_10]OGE86598.1 MAG: hypothetical protein A3E28_04290 [Candidatus Doudnabacteria bacterium RIFCSPHIGHO2_12_FULL_42_22]OGE87498.1 MAG: hypothetical protein A3C49_03950 [Candidatus Doudnabacteria bacterium RIFCSPHIGHO2_02_FULL_42_25]OGE92767.1 MAG: hypothetical protein A2895_04565 [Candidatus
MTLNLLKNIAAVVVLILIGLAVERFAIRRESPPPIPQETNFDFTGHIVRNNPGLKPDTWYLIYEKPGQPALNVELKFDEKSFCFVNDQSIFCSEYTFTVGQAIHVEGVEKDNIVLIRQMIVLEDVEPAKLLQIKLYYYNEDRDREISGGEWLSLDPEAVIPVERQIPTTMTPIQDAIRLLIRGELSSEERDEGFMTEFPNEDFKLLGANLKAGVLTLEFTEVPGFTMGGSARIRLMTASITKTAKQFSEVKTVKFLPEEIFQP